MNDPQQNHEWTDCPKGQIAQIARSSKSRERHQIVRGVAVCVSTFCVLLFAGYLFIGQPFSSDAIGAISCQDVLKHAKAFLTGEVDEDLAKKIRHHIADCESCRKKLEQMKNNKPHDQSRVFLKDRDELLSVLE